MTFCLDVVANIVQKTEQSEAFGTVLSRKREAIGWSQGQLADRCGVTRSYISQLESVRKLKDGVTPQKPSKEISDALAEALGESKDYFRRLNGYPTLEEDDVENFIASEFASALNRYRLLGSSSREFIQTQVRMWIDHLLEREGLEKATDGSVQKIQHKDPKSLPGITLAEAKRRANKK